MLAFGLLDDISICAGSLTFAFGAVSASYILMLLRHHYVAVGVAEDAVSVPQVLLYGNLSLYLSMNGSAAMSTQASPSSPSPSAYQEP